MERETEIKREGEKIGATKKIEVNTSRKGEGGMENQKRKKKRRKQNSSDES